MDTFYQILSRAWAEAEGVDEPDETEEDEFIEPDEGPQPHPPQPVAEAAAAPVVEPEAMPKAEPKAKPEAKPEAEPKALPKAEAKPELKNSKQIVELSSEEQAKQRAILMARREALKFLGCIFL